MSQNTNNTHSLTITIQSFSKDELIDALEETIAQIKESLYSGDISTPGILQGAGDGSVCQAFYIPPHSFGEEKVQPDSPDLPPVSIADDEDGVLSGVEIDHKSKDALRELVAYLEEILPGANIKIRNVSNE